jgi:hypothetical protein
MKNKLSVMFKAISISVGRAIALLIFGKPEYNLQDRIIRLLVVTLASFAFFPIIIVTNDDIYNYADWYRSNKQLVDLYHNISGLMLLLHFIFSIYLTLVGNRHRGFSWRCFFCGILGTFLYVVTINSQQ